MPDDATSGPAPQRALEGRGIVLVGGAGFIGHHLAIRLAAAGARVRVIDHLRVNNLRDLSEAPALPNRALYLALLRRRLERLARAGIPVQCVDACDVHALARAADDLDGAAVVHLAAVAHADRSNRAPHAAFQSTLASLAAVLEVARGRAARVLYFSSSMVYGDFVSAAAAEDHPLRPIGVYGALKLAGEELVRAHQRVFGLPFTIVRPSALYGPGCVSGRVTQRFVESAMQGEPLVVEGDGSERVDFTYVDDLTDGVARALASPAAENETFNLTCGNARSLLELADVVGASFPGTRVVFAPRDRLRPRRGTLCVDRARALLGYAPRVQLEQGIARCVHDLRTCGLPPSRWADGPAAVASPWRLPSLDAAPEEIPLPS